MYGRNPTPVDRWFIPLFAGLQHGSTVLLVVQDFATIPMTGELLPMEPSRWKEADGDDGAMEVEKKEEEEEKVKDTLVF